MMKKKLMMMMMMMTMMIINYCRLTASEARNRRTLNPLVELWREGALSI